MMNTKTLEPKKKLQSKIFTYVNSVTYDKIDFSEDIDFEQNYISWLMNKSLSFNPDTILEANYLNMLPFDFDKKLQFLYLLNTLRKKKRYSKWIKNEKDDNVELVMNYYNFNVDKAKTALRLLTEEQLDIIRTKSNRGGINE